MKEFWSFFLGGSEALALEISLLFAGLLCSALLAYLEYRFPKAAWWFMAAGAIAASLLTIAFLVLGASLAMLLAALLLMLLARVLLIYIKGRDAS